MTGVCLVAADAPGGIRTYTNMIAGALSARHPDRAVFRVDSRGRSAWLSPLICLTVAFRLLRWRMSGRVDVLHLMASERMSLWRKAFLAAVGRSLGLRVIVHHHGAEMPSLTRRGGPQSFVLGLVGRLAHRHLVLGEAWRTALLAAGASAKAITVLPNALPERAAPVRTRRDGRMRALFLGEMSARKGVPVLLDALARLGVGGPEMELVLAGDGPLRADAARRAARSDRPVRVLGQVAPGDAARLMETSDLLVHPSLHEGLPMTILEALRAGLPVIATPVGAIADSLPDGAGVVHVPPGDVDALAKAMESLIRDGERRRRLGEAGRRTFEARFRLEAHIDRLTDLYGWEGSASRSPRFEAPVRERVA
jgi:glycosyltransferase involved in cell wall biosynthesis